MKINLTEYLFAPSYRPETFSEICASLKVRGAERKKIQRSLNHLKSKGLIRIRKDHRYIRSETRSRPTPPRRERLSKPEVRAVVGVLKKNRQGQYSAIPIGREVQQIVHLDPTPRLPDLENQTVAEIQLQWKRSNTRYLVGELRSVLGSLNDPKTDSRIVMARYGLPKEFEESVINEANRLAINQPIAPTKDRVDLRHLDFVTIDGEDAKDHDDAVALDEKGNLWVAIADVAQYVPADSLVDREAAIRGNSYYFPDRVVPMLPEILSNNVASLKPNEDRLVLAAKMEVSTDGRLRNTALMEGIIKSRARLTYEGVDQANVPSNLLPMLREMKALSQRTYRARTEDGGIDFELSETKVVLSKNGEVETLARRTRTPAQQLIEEFMLLANKGVASTLKNTDYLLVYRLHDRPDERKLDDFLQLLRGHGFKTKWKGSDITPQRFNELLHQFRNPQLARVYSFLALRSMPQAYYSTHNIGHYGLGFPDYVHFTSPIRRYADLMVHRSVKQFLHNEKPDEDELIPTILGSAENTSAHISSCERVAQITEREIRTIKTIRFMSKKIGQIFDGAIVGVIPQGFFVELRDIAAEGFVHLSRLPKDRYQFLETEMAMKGVHRQRKFRIGDPIKIKVESTDLFTFRIDFSLA